MYLDLVEVLGSAHSDRHTLGDDVLDRRERAFIDEQGHAGVTEVDEGVAHRQVEQLPLPPPDGLGQLGDGLGGCSSGFDRFRTSLSRFGCGIGGRGDRCIADVGRFVHAVRRTLVPRTAHVAPLSSA